jgi:hypothetical protein
MFKSLLSQTLKMNIDFIAAIVPAVVPGAPGAVAPPNPPVFPNKIPQEDAHPADAKQMLI